MQLTNAAMDLNVCNTFLILYLSIMEIIVYLKTCLFDKKLKSGLYKVAVLKSLY